MKLVFPIWQSPRRLILSGTKSESPSISLHASVGPAAGAGMSSTSWSCGGEKHPSSRWYRAWPPGEEHATRWSQRRRKKRRTTARWTKRAHLWSRRVNVWLKRVMARWWWWRRRVEGQAPPSTRDGEGGSVLFCFLSLCFLLSSSLIRPSLSTIHCCCGNDRMVRRRLRAEGNG